MLEQDGEFHDHLWWPKAYRSRFFIWDKIIDNFLQTDIAHFVTDAARNREADEQFRKVCNLRRMFETHVHNKKMDIAANTTVLIVKAYK